MKTKLILIGGVPGTGKTTIAYHLALKFKIDKVISLDTLKLYAKTFNNNFNKYIFTTTHEAYKLENIPIIDGYLKHSNEINKLLIKTLDNIKDNIIIIEGSTINKNIINLLDKDKYEIIYFNLYLDSKELIERYKLKSKIRKSTWIENIKNIEEINNYLLKDNLSFYNKDLKETLERITNYVKKDLCLQ